MSFNNVSYIDTWKKYIGVLDSIGGFTTKYRLMQGWMEIPKSKCGKETMLHSQSVHGSPCYEWTQFPLMIEYFGTSLVNPDGPIRQ